MRRLTVTTIDKDGYVTRDGRTSVLIPQASEADRRTADPLLADVEAQYELGSLPENEVLIYDHNRGGSGLSYWRVSRDSHLLAGTVIGSDMRHWFVGTDGSGRYHVRQGTRTNYPGSSGVVVYDILQDGYVHGLCDDLYLIPDGIVCRRGRQITREPSHQIIQPGSITYRMYRDGKARARIGSEIPSTPSSSAEDLGTLEEGEEIVGSTRTHLAIRRDGHLHARPFGAIDQDVLLTKFPNRLEVTTDSILWQDTLGIFEWRGDKTVRLMPAQQARYLVLTEAQASQVGAGTVYYVRSTAGENIAIQDGRVVARSQDVLLVQERVTEI